AQRHRPIAFVAEGLRLALYLAFNLDSAVGIARKRDAQPFRSEVDGFLPRGRHRSAVLRGQVKPHRNAVRERKMTLKFHSQTPSLLQDCTSRPAFSV
ncbi:MAG: hypothetical protein ABWZ17_06345, partial [Candidatus Binatia bacterium]